MSEKTWRLVQLSKSHFSKQTIVLSLTNIHEQEGRKKNALSNRDISRVFNDFFSGSERILPLKHYSKLNEKKV